MWVETRPEVVERTDRRRGQNGDRHPTISYSGTNSTPFGTERQQKVVNILSRAAHGRLAGDATRQQSPGLAGARLPMLKPALARIC